MYLHDDITRFITADSIDRFGLDSEGLFRGSEMDMAYVACDFHAELVELDGTRLPDASSQNRQLTGVHETTSRAMSPIVRLRIQAELQKHLIAAGSKDKVSARKAAALWAKKNDYDPIVVVGMVGAMKAKTILPWMKNSRYNN